MRLLCMLFAALLAVAAFLSGTLFQATPGLAASVVQGAIRLDLPDAVAEGEPFLLRLRCDDSSVASLRVRWMERELDVPLDGRPGAAQLVLGAGLGAKPGTRTLEVSGGGGQALAQVRVRAGSFPVQRLSLPPRMVTPSAEDQERIKAEQALQREALSVVSPRRLWATPFQQPVPGVVTSAFGLRRVLNGQPRSPHAGLDLDGFEGEPVLCANAGRVVLVGDFYYNGKSVFVDHGQGLVTMYFHLSRVDVAQGAMLARGQVLGLVGATGRATGPHLHYGLKSLGQSLDPLPLAAPGGAFDTVVKGGS